MVSIKGLDKAKVLKALYDNSHVEGMGFVHAAPEGTVTEDRCRELLEKNTAYDYLYGRVMKVDLAGDEFDERLYDRDCGEGAAQRAVDSITQERESEKHQAQEDEKPKEEAGQKDGGAKKEKSMAEKTERRLCISNTLYWGRSRRRGCPCRRWSRGGWTTPPCSGEKRTPCVSCGRLAQGGRPGGRIKLDKPILPHSGGTYKSEKINAPRRVSGLYGVVI